MVKVQYNTKPLIKEVDGTEKIFCPIRKKWLNITPEEWVRQNFINFLTVECGYAKPLIAIERLVNVGELKQRFDIVVFDNTAKPYIIIECKEMNVVLNEKVLHQVLRYNSSLQAPYFCITNGSYTYLFKKTKEHFTELEEFPKAK